MEIERVKLITKDKVNELLNNVEERNANIGDKIIQLQTEKSILIQEKDELSIELVSAELKGDSNLKTKINVEIEKRIGKLIKIDSQIEAYNQYKNNYYADTENIMHMAAKEYVEDKEIRNKKLFSELEKVCSEIEQMENEIREKEKKKSEIMFHCYTLKPYDEIGSEILKIINYMKPDLKDKIQQKLESNKYRSESEDAIYINNFLEENYESLSKIPKKKASILDKYFKKN